MIPTEAFIGAYRDKLTALRDAKALELAGQIRSGEMHDAIVKAGFIKGLEEAHDLINDVIKDEQR